MKLHFLSIGVKIPTANQWIAPPTDRMRKSHAATVSRPEKLHRQIMRADNVRLTRLEVCESESGWSSYEVPDSFDSIARPVSVRSVPVMAHFLTDI